MQQSFIDAVLVLLGVAVGALITWGRDWWRNRQHRQDTRKVLEAELSASFDTLNEGLIIFGKEEHVVFYSDNPIYDDFPLSVDDYDKLDRLALAKALTKDALSMVRGTYRAIKYYNKVAEFGPAAKAFNRSSNLILVQQIEETLRLIKQ